MGKTHLLHAVGNAIVDNKPNAKVVYMHSERFVQDMVKALQNNAIEEFKRYYRSVDALLIDDIQFFAHKERSQEEFFHTFNALIEHDDPLRHTEDTVEFMGYDNYGRSDSLVDVQNQRVDFSGDDGIQPCRGFIQKENFRVEGQSPGQSGAFFHTAAQFRW